MELLSRRSRVSAVSSLVYHIDFGDRAKIKDTTVDDGERGLDEARQIGTGLKKEKMGGAPQFEGYEFSRLQLTIPANALLVQRIDVVVHSKVRSRDRRVESRGNGRNDVDKVYRWGEGRGRIGKALISACQREAEESEQLQ